MADPLPPDTFRFLVRHTPLVSLDLLIVDPDGRVLLGLRNNQPARGCWFVPGGIIFKDERLDTAFRRILAAETGLSRGLSEARHVGLFEHHYDTNRMDDPGYGTHYVVNAFRLDVASRPAIAADSQHREMAWMTPREIVAHPQVHANTKAYFLPSS
jgi:colanic acid biosynthesis protein WcaH